MTQAAHQLPEEPTIGDKIRYYIDLFMSWSPMARFIGLFGVSFILVSVCAVLAMLVSPSDAEYANDFFEAMWWAMTRVADAGTMGDDHGTMVRLVATLSTLSGVFVVALLIGLVSSTIGEKIEDLQKGKSPVIDHGHTLILGFGEKVFPILRELREANSNQKHASIVILSETDKLEVEELVRERLGDMRTTRVVVRQGSPSSPQDLRKVGAGRAKSIIVLASGDGAAHDQDDPGQADMQAIKTLLALRRIPGALTKNHVVVELIDAHRAPVLTRLGSGGVEIIAMRETLARLMVQTARQSGLAHVYQDLMGYDGSEFYFKNFPELAGVTFGKLQPAMHNAIPVGIRRPKGGDQFETILNPADDVVIGPADELLVLAEDDDSFKADMSNPLRFQAVQPVSGQAKKRVTENILLCGYRTDIAKILNEFDQYLLKGSTICLMPGDQHAVLDEELKGVTLKNAVLRVVAGDTTHPDFLKDIPGMSFDAVLLVADDTVSADESDAKTVIALLLLRDLYDKQAGSKKPRIISEILDPRTKDLVASDETTDFVVSSEITSMLLAQVSERRELNAVFADLFDSDGNEIYLKSASRYAPINQPVSWLAVQDMARSYGEVAIGCFRHGVNPLLNPKQGDALQFSATDKIIVVAEDDSEEARVVRKAA